MTVAAKTGSKPDVAAWPAAVENLSGRADIVLVCEHASRFIPPEYADLGLTGDALTSHIAWDPGALPVAMAMSHILDAPLVWQQVSRLVYDCNRPPDAPAAMAEKSEVFAIPGNTGLSDAARAERVAKFYTPFRETLGAVLDDRIAAGRPPAIVTIHSFSPVYFGKPRPLDLGILHDSDTRLADAMLAGLSSTADISVEENEPYGPEDGVTHTLVDQAISRNLANVMIEIRNDLIAKEAGQQRFARLLSDAAARALETISAGAAHA